MLTALGDLARATLARYPTTLAEDLAELGGPSAPVAFSNRRNVLVLLAGEKAAALDCERLATDAAVWLLATDVVAALASARAAASLGEIAGAGRACYEADLARYLRAVVVPLLEAHVLAIK